MLTEESDSIDRRVLVVALIPFLALAFAHWSVPPAVASGDWAHYILHAKALLEGRPYEDTGYIATPLNVVVGPKSQPPGLPLTLLPLVAIGGVNSPLIKLLAIGSGVAFLWFAVRALSRQGSSWLAIAAVALTGIALESTFATAAIGSDLGFCALIWVVIWAMDAPGPPTARRLVAVTLAGGFAMAYRLAGVALIPALLLYALVNWKETTWKPLVPVAVWTIGAMFVLLTLTVLPAYIGLDHIVNQLTLRQLKLTFHQYKLGYFGSVLYPFASNRLNDVYHLLAGGFALVGVARLVPAWRQSFVSAFVVAYSVMLLLVRVHEPRYIWVLYPLLAYATLYGLVSVIQWLRPRMPALVARRIAVATAVVLAAAGCAQILRTPPRRGLLADADTQALFARLKEEGPATRVAFTNPRVLTLETGIPAMPLIHNADSTVIRELRVHRITHVITDTLNIQPYSTELFLRLARELPDVFRPIYRNPTFVLYRLDWPNQDVSVPKAQRDTVTP